MARHLDRLERQHEAMAGVKPVVAVEKDATPGLQRVGASEIEAQRPTWGDGTHPIPAGDLHPITTRWSSDRVAVSLEA
jgi:hypothetical protein